MIICFIYLYHVNRIVDVIRCVVDFFIKRRCGINNGLNIGISSLFLLFIRDRAFFNLVIFLRVLNCFRRGRSDSFGCIKRSE